MEICLSMKEGSVLVNFTIGFGNNLFQYAFGKILSEKLGLPMRHAEIRPFGIERQYVNYNNSLSTMLINDPNCVMALNSKRSDVNYLVQGYFENYEIYRPYINQIKTWFPKHPITNKKDLILHFRLQNRLIQQSHCKNHVSFEAFERGINNFEFDKLHIVTDAKKWDFYTKEDIEEIQNDIRKGPNPPSNSPWIPTDQSLDYINHLIEGFSKYDIVVHCNDADVIPGSGGLRDDFIDDFNLIRSFDKIMFKDSTFSWWAAMLSDATHISAFRPWKPNKGSSNKNLGLTDFPGWKPWGTYEDLING